MPRIVLTVIGDDRPGLVRALAEVISRHSGNWERSQMAELAGKFAGIVVVSLPAQRTEELTAALRALDGLLEVTAHPEAPKPAVAAPEWRIDLLGTDRPGIVHEVSSVLNRHHVSIETMDTLTREAPMAGGQLFEARVVVRPSAASDVVVMRTDLEHLAAELLVEIAIAPGQAG